ncbi:MAG: helix-turn-helix domain-containing protein [Nitrospirae bacterium]|nr:helix-turn-helix domain-containing protein [Nitrospirota bacterium]
MQKISSGIKSLDGLIDSLHIGDNVVWETEAGTSEEIFIQNFIHNSLIENRDVIYVSFNRSPQSLLLYMNINNLVNTEKVIMLDCFTTGKGKRDKTFVKFYETDRPAYPNIIKVERPNDISFFNETINSIQEKLSGGALYIFDSLTGIQDLWGDESSTYKFFTYMCPRLYDLGTVAYWILEKEAHSQTFKANLRHITQVVIELYKRRDKLFLKALKLDGRTDREAFKPHSYEIEDGNILILPAKKEPSYDIGSRVKEARGRLNMSQKDLADKIGLTPSFISQLENNQISPSLNSFLQIADTLGINPAIFLQQGQKNNGAEWLIDSDTMRDNLFEKDQSYSIFNIISKNKTSAFITVLNPSAELNRHFLQHKREELIYVIKGNITVKIDNKERMLKPGDSVYITDSLPSLWKNNVNEEAELLVMCI